MSVNKEEGEDGGHYDYFPEKIGAVLAVCSFVFPNWFQYDPSHITIWAGGWMLQIRNLQYTSSIAFHIANFGPLLPLMIFIGGPQILFAYFIYRVYERKSTVRKAFAVGSLGFIPPMILNIPNLLYDFTSPGFPFWPIFPIPLTLLLGYVLINRTPPPEDTPGWLQ
ncbi:MAG: hypothetical protein GF309_11655 [Candidatus Lokiarchaeota archaeon]|nr:hypothetical protein [Candidatus Lokiarchaeota archaeon]